MTLRNGLGGQNHQTTFAFNEIFGLFCISCLTMKELNTPPQFSHLVVIFHNTIVNS